MESVDYLDVAMDALIEEQNLAHIDEQMDLWLEPEEEKHQSLPQTQELVFSQSYYSWGASSIEEALDDASLCGSLVEFVRGEMDADCFDEALEWISEEYPEISLPSRFALARRLMGTLT